jgi:hypothetical protein
VGCQKLRYKDVTKRQLKKIECDVNTWERDAKDRDVWKGIVTQSVTRSKKVGWKSINDDDNHAIALNRTYSVISADAVLFRTQEERRIYERTNVGNEKEQPLTSQSSSKNDGRSYIHTYIYIQKG